MDGETRFEEPCPPLTETFSFRRLPCRLEEQSLGSTSTSNPAERSCPQQQFCFASSPALITLERAYGSRIKVTLAEPSSSIVVRSEHQFNKHERRRLGLRKHIYELSSRHGPGLSRTRRSKEPFVINRRFIDYITQLHKDAGIEISQSLLDNLNANENKECHDIDSLQQVLPPPTSDYLKRWRRIVTMLAFAPVDCYRIENDDRFGHYLGFMDLRPNSTYSPLALGILGLPRRYRHNPDVHIVTGCYGPIFGGPSFPATVYSMHDPNDGGAPCAQACAIMALGLLSDRGSRITGNYTLTYIANREKKHLQQNIGEPSQDSQHLGNSPSPKGSRLSFRARGVGLSSEEIEKILNERGVSAYRLKTRVSDASGRMVRRLIEAYIIARFPVVLAVDATTWWPWRKKELQGGHAVLVVGFRRMPNHSGEMSLITHDPGYMPFYERPFNDCEKACAAYCKDNFFRAIFVAPRTVAIHGATCIKSLRDSENEFKQFWNAENQCDYRVALLVLDDIADRLFARPAYPQLGRQFVSKLQRVLDKVLARATYWCVVGLSKGRVRVAWLFDARGISSRGPAKWLARIEFHDYRRVEVVIARGGSSFVRLTV